MRTSELVAFIEERYRIWENKEKGLPKPWTEDKILQNYRFCNVYRELDPVTQWYAENWRQSDPDCWFVSLVFRLINLPETAEHLGYPSPWSPKRWVRVMEARKREGWKIYNPAYIVSTNGVKQVKHLYLAEQLTAIWKQRESIAWRGAARDSLEAMHKRLTGLNAVGSFIAGQVIADIKYLRNIKSEAADWYSFAASGPGSRRGLHRVMGYEDYEAHWNEAAWRRKLTELQIQVDPIIKSSGMPRLHAQDLQNCLCEFDKYERVRLGQGKPKSRYNGGKL